MGKRVGMGKAPPTGNPRPRPCVYLSGDGDRDRDDFGGGDGDKKAFLGLTLPRSNPSSHGPRR
ncbi:hypothetical protein TIFTF001_031782 [Ficus carica]|uniref:Uncharacterized protein n=1 Tax=Ficus carica TaxID=3494 RepID=A0AA88DVT2_FICCA|nr:hypothetical protein TIFTF001_031782 [Ficus carica]